MKRYAAMETCAKMLEMCREDMIIQVSDILKSNRYDYRLMADRVDADKLHPVLKDIHISLIETGN